MLKPKSETTSTTAGVIGSKMALRSKWIKQKRAAVMDEKALQEIFMIK
jgi:Pin2-interacting protein X1